MVRGAGGWGECGAAGLLGVDVVEDLGGGEEAGVGEFAAEVAQEGFDFSH